MAEIASLESFQALYANLSTLPEQQQFLNLDRLGAELDAHAQYFRALLDRKAKNGASRQSLSTGKLTVAETEYAINSEFQQGTIQLADDLDLDEIEAAKLFLAAQHDSDVSERPVLTEAVIRFHQRRKYLLDCLRSILQLVVDVAVDGEIQEGLRKLLNDQVLQSSSTAPGFVGKCLAAMTEIRAWIQRLAEKANTAAVTGQSSKSEVAERLEYERISLIKQHETLGLIVFYLVKENRSDDVDFDSVLGTLQKSDRYDSLLVHYLPALSALISRYAAIGDRGSRTLEIAGNWHEKFMRSGNWTLNYVHAAVRAWWIVEYSNCFVDNHDGSLSDTQLDTKLKSLSTAFSQALGDGAFDFMLSLSADVKSAEWQDPARHGLRQWLQRKSPVLLPDSTSFAALFQDLLMEQMETFVESFITNLPDVLRKLRVDEDQQRQLSKEHEHDLDLERFIVIISYAFENRPKAAHEGFWFSKDSALYGFLQWASRRASTPLVSAFCEMLQALSEGEENATAAHEFLLDEGSQTSSKMRRSHALTWNQIFKELAYFSAKIRDRVAVAQPQSYRPGKPQNDLAESEPESSLMLECYLRLITRLCSESLTTRQFIAQHPTFHLVELLFQLAGSAIEPRLRACAFTTLRSLLSGKDKATGEFLWNSLELWVSGGYSTGTSTSKAIASSASHASIQAILSGMAAGFEEPNAFVQFLHALVLPYGEDSGLRDLLPFPEQLGATTRMPGIDPYIDFVLGQIFAARSAELGDAAQVRLLQLTCLDFITTCLDTFNENLVIFATETSISIDAAIGTSSLQDYVMLHPFSRVMEWMYDEKVMNALFASVHHDASDIATVDSDSPLMLCILRGIQVVTRILELQPTYLDIIRPVIQAQATSKRTPVLSAKFSSFEDGVLNHLSIFPDLGLLCGTGHPEIVMASLKLLQILSASSKLTTVPGATFGNGAGHNRALAALDEDADTISKTMLREIESTIDFNQGPNSPDYIVKIQILDFLIAGLRASPLRPSIAHRLLGFQCERESLSIDSNGTFDAGISLFHSILDLAIDSPVSDEFGLVSWLVTLNYKSQQVIRELWASPLSSAITLAELTASDGLSALLSKEIHIEPYLLWDGVSISDPTFLMQSAALCFGQYLSRRTLILQYTSTELRKVSKDHAPSLKKRILETIMGSTTVDNGQVIDHASLFDFFDFLEPEFLSIEYPDFEPFGVIDFNVCQEESAPLQIFNLGKVEELLILRRAELVNTGKIHGSQDLQSINAAAQTVIEFYELDNRLKTIHCCRLEVLGAWVQLASVVITNGDFDTTSKTTFILRALQTIMPTLESSFENIPIAMELAKLAKTLIFALDFKSESFQQGDMGELVGDRLFHLFQVSLRAISLLGAQSSLKEIFYNIGYHYLTSMSSSVSVGAIRKRHSIQTIKSVGDRFIDVVCDDAHAGTPTCRIAALLLLGSLVKLSRAESSSYIVDALIRLNFIGILVDSLSTIPDELRATRAEDTNLQISYCHAKLSLLLQLAQTRAGATAVLNAGLFHHIKQSGLFSIDPDLGVDIEGPDTVTKHYNLLSALLRVICAALLSRGAQNELSLEQGRRFLTDNKLSTMAVFKKSAGLGSSSAASEESVLELVEVFVVLINVTGYLDFDEDIGKKRQPVRAFT